MYRGSLHNRKGTKGKDTDAGDAAGATGRGGFSVTWADARDGCTQGTGGRKAVQEPDIIYEFMKEAVSCISTLTI